jgi:hypothetical protein
MRAERVFPRREIPHRTASFYRERRVEGVLVQRKMVETLAVACSRRVELKYVMPPEVQQWRHPVQNV